VSPTLAEVLEDPQRVVHISHDHLLTTHEAVAKLGISADWLYRRADKLPFTARLGPRLLRFSARPTGTPYTVFHPRSSRALCAPIQWLCVLSVLPVRRGFQVFWPRVLWEVASQPVAVYLDK